MPPESQINEDVKKLDQLFALPRNGALYSLREVLGKLRTEDVALYSRFCVSIAHATHLRGPLPQHMKTSNWGNFYFLYASRRNGNWWD